MATTLTLLGDTNGKVNVTGEAYRADEWFGVGGGQYTVSFHVHNLKGRVYLEASLAANPSEDDWFPIWLTATTPYVEYPRDRAKPTGTAGHYGDTGVDAFNFEGNFSWLRVRLDRNYILPVPVVHEDIAAFGVIRKVLLKR